MGILELSSYGKLNKYLIDHAGEMKPEEYNRFHDAVMKVTTGIMDMVLLKRELEKRKQNDQFSACCREP